MKFLKLNLLFLGIINILCTSLIAQQIQISGYITSETGEMLSAALIYVNNGEQNTYSNDYGYYNLPVPNGKITLNVNFLGYQPWSAELFVTSDTTINIEMQVKLLPTVEVTESSTFRPLSNFLTELPVIDLKQIPNIGGESDILKSLAIYPGVAFGSEGNANLFVRGGTPDQNLILLDDIPVYNITHLGGYLSVFNTESLRSVKLLKGGYPAQYGGRLSSILDVKLREGNKKEYRGSIGLGIITSKFSLEGPIKKNQSSFMLTGRTSYLGLINAFTKKEEVPDYYNYWLYDVNAKVNFKMKKGNLFVSYYKSQDKNEIKGTSESIRGQSVLTRRLSNENLQWGNQTFSTRYILPISNRLFFKAIIGFTQYQYLFEDRSFNEVFGIDGSEIEQQNNKTQSGIKSYLAKFKFDYTLNKKHHLQFGGELEHQQFSTHFNDTLSFGNNSSILSTYFGDEYHFSKKLILNGGFRLSAFPSKIKTFFNLEPRASIEHIINDNISLKATYSRMTQYLHLLSSYSIDFPNDIWVSASDLAPPAISNQTSLGVFTKFKNKYHFQAEVFYKRQKQLIDYRTGRTNIISPTNWTEDIAIAGKGKGYGIELYHKNTFSKLTSTIAYTLSWNYRQFDEINNNEWFPFTYDRRHDFSILTNYRFNSKWNLSLNWIFQTGRRITLPTAVIVEPFMNTELEVFSHRNNGTLPNYHRLDFALNYEKITKRKNTFGWSLSVYNAYNRANPSYLILDGKVIFDELGEFSHVTPQVTQVSLFPILPSFSIYYKFE